MVEILKREDTNDRVALLQSIPLQSSKTTIQISNLTSGSYLFKVKSPKGTIVKKIVKN